MQKVIIKVDWSSEKRKKKAIKMVSENEDVQSFEVDDPNKQLTMYDDMDPIMLVKKMRKQFPTDIVTTKLETPPVVNAPPKFFDHHPPFLWEPSGSAAVEGYRNVFTETSQAL